MKKTVLIVGAGASLAEAIPSHPKRSLTPPLDATFFELCRQAGYQGQPSVRKYMDAEFGIDPFTGGYGMEEIFNYIYTDAFSSHPSPGCLDAYWALIGMYRSAIANTTNPLHGKSRSGIGSVIRTLLDHEPDREISIVTFNQDLVIEKAIEATKGMRKYSAIPWSLVDAYGATFKRTVAVATSTTHFTNSGGPSIDVLKMHGSLNWVYRVRSGSDPKNSLRTPPADLVCVNDQRIFPRLTETVRGSKRTRQYDVIPLIVPPIYEKSARYQAVLQPVWDLSSAALHSAEELIVFGYSFPDADFSSKALIRQCLHKNTALRMLHVIDVSASTAGKIADIVPLSSCHSYETAVAFKEIYTDEN